jgi:sigma-B regulation protein RsbU (phosphoserine phosphatase)
MAFAARHAALLDALAALWARLGAGRFTWRDMTGRELYASGPAAGGAISAPLLGGTLSVEGGPDASQPLLAAQAALLHEAIRAEADADMLVDELVRTTDQLVALYEVATAARAGHDLGDVMLTVVQQATQLTGAAASALVVSESWHDPLPPRVFVSPASARLESSGAALLAVSRRQPEERVANSAPECAALLGDALGPVQRAVCVPITIGGQTDAVLYAIDKPADFTNGDLKLMMALADTAAGFLERERSHARELAQARFRRELEIAADIQSRLMPHDVPSLPGVQVATLWQPSREVGGDFFDVQVLPGDRLALTLGDVTGKGVPAALLAAMAHALLRFGFAAAQSPGGAVRALHAGLAHDLSSADRLLTLFASVYDPQSGELRAINCGHSPVLVCQAGRVEVWEPDGPPIGLLPDLLSVERARPLTGGDALIVLSDGFSEARNTDAQRLGLEPLVEVVQRVQGGTASGIAQALRQHVDAFAGGHPQADDQTLVVVKVA